MKTVPYKFNTLTQTFSFFKKSFFKLRGTWKTTKVFGVILYIGELLSLDKDTSAD